MRHQEIKEKVIRSALRLKLNYMGVANFSLLFLGEILCNIYIIENILDQGFIAFFSDLHDVLEIIVPHETLLRVVFDCLLTETVSRHQSLSLFSTNF